MTYEIQKIICDSCKDVNYCVQVDLNWFCDDCFSWQVHDAKVKDRIIKTLTEFGMEDIEKC